MRPSLSLPALAFFLGLSFVGAIPAPAGTWSSRDGARLPGEPVAFDFGEKTLTFRDAISRHDLTVPTRDLSLRSRQKLLVSPLFLRSDQGGTLWPPAKRKLVLLAIAAPAFVLFICFWASAWSFTDKVNPVLAVIGYLGSWVILGIFAVCYSLLMMRLGGGSKIMLVGAVVALSVTPLYLSAVYNCTYGKAHLILLTHLIAASCIFGFGLASVEMILGKKHSETWWDAVVFEPLGLIGPGEPLPQRDS